MKHVKTVGEYTDMEKLAEDIGNLHYETLGDLLNHLSRKFKVDSKNDRANGKPKLARMLDYASMSTQNTKGAINSAWDISQPFMEKDEE